MTTHDSVQGVAPSSEDLGAGQGGVMAGGLEANEFDVHLPHLDPKTLSGQLIVIEGPDGSGRSTQIKLLTEWLEIQGHAVQTMGLRRSRLLAENIDALLSSNELQPLTMALLYATDFFDQLANRIIPALQGGFVVLADRYIYTLMTRAAVRGMGRDYLSKIYEFAVKPDLLFHLDIPPTDAFDRLFEKQNSVSYWETGRDLDLSPNLYDSFLQYQQMLRDEFVVQTEGRELERINGSLRVAEVNRRLRESVGGLLQIEDLSYEPSDELLPLWRL